VRQRVQALNLFLHDLYHEQMILRDGVGPRGLVLGNANFRPAMQGIDLPHVVYGHICGIDIVRAEHGAFKVLEDNARTPSGVSYDRDGRARGSPRGHRMHRHRRSAERGACTASSTGSSAS
jgi:uncharacterized circularly permuted ATP-grasp superfamily protein